MVIRIMSSLCLLCLDYIQIEEKKQRLDDLRKQAAEKAELEWKEKKERMERQQNEERDLEEKRKKLEEMRREQEIAAEHERNLMQEEADKIRKHEESLLVSQSILTFFFVLDSWQFLLQFCEDINLSHFVACRRRVT